LLDSLLLEIDNNLATGQSMTEMKIK